MAPVQVLAAIAVLSKSTVPSRGQPAKVTVVVKVLLILASPVLVTTTVISY